MEICGAARTSARDLGQVCVGDTTSSVREGDDDLYLGCWGAAVIAAVPRPASEVFGLMLFTVYIRCPCADAARRDQKKSQ